MTVALRVFLVSQCDFVGMLSKVLGGLKSKRKHSNISKEATRREYRSFYSAAFN